MSKKVLIGLSGGVDSAFATYLLKKQGYEVEALYLKLHGREDYFQENITKAKYIANVLNVSLHILDVQKDFFQTVYKPFVETYISGATPNPCIVCNREMKFGKMFEFAKKIGADYLATGHYLKHDNKFLIEGKDKNKDQSYFLFNIDKYLIPHLIFPLGDYLKSEVVQEIAKIPELKDIASNRESLEICFVENSYVDIIRDYKNVDEVGDVLDENGNLIGKHKGYIHYTIGKRKGFTLKVAHEPHYVTKIIPEKNQIVVGTRNKLKKYEATLGNLNMFIDETEFQAEVKLRYRSKLLKADVKIENEIAKIKLHEPIFGLAKGQAGVFYRDKKVIGGGWIL